MALDLSKMKAKRDALENRGGKKEFWRPEDGETTIRLLPTPDGDPFKEYWFHYNLGKNPGFLSPKKNFGEECPLDSFVRQLYKEGSDESIKMAKDLSARQRFFSPVLVRGEEDQGVRLWGFSKTTYESLLNIVLDPEYGDITDPHTGTDLRLEYGKKAGQMYPTTDIRPFRKASKLAKTDEEIDTLLSSMPVFEEVFPETTTEAAQLLLDQTLNSSSEDTGEGTVKYSNQTASTNNNTSSDGTDIDQAFDDLLA